MQTYDDPNADIVIDTDDDVLIISARNVRVVRCGDLDASGATIGGDLNASGATIGGWLDASGATIGGDLSANDATISGVLIARPTPAEREMIISILAESDSGHLQMDRWHSCNTAHCIAGFAQAMSGRPQRDDTALADGRELLPSVSHLFFTTEAVAIKEMRRILAAE